MPTPLDREHLTELHCIQPVTNVASILALGILSHESARDVPHDSVALEEIQDRRSRVTIPGTGRKLHSYANLYVNGRNKMMYKLLYGPGHERLCVLRISLDVLDRPGVIIADRNASADAVAFRAAPDGLRQITKELVLARYWTHEDPIVQQRHGQIVCAEVLVPDVVPPALIDGVYASCEPTAVALRGVEACPEVTVKPDLFFQ